MLGREEGPPEDGVNDEIGGWLLEGCDGALDSDSEKEGESLGEAEGKELGDVDAPAEGSADWIREGVLLGELESDGGKLAATEGLLDGMSLVPSDGDSVGLKVGVSDGDSVGLYEGLIVGYFVGAWLGELEIEGGMLAAADGLIDGVPLGSIDGDAVGLKLGRELWLAVGVAVGSPVGWVGQNDESLVIVTIIVSANPLLAPGLLSHTVTNKVERSLGFLLLILNIGLSRSTPPSNSVPPPISSTIVI